MKYCCSASSSKGSEVEEKDITNNKELEETEATESDSDEEEVLLPKKRKIYKQKFKEQWTESFEWLKNVKGGNYCELCLTFIEGQSFEKFTISFSRQSSLAVCRHVSRSSDCIIIKNKKKKGNSNHCRISIMIDESTYVTTKKAYSSYS